MVEANRFLRLLLAFLLGASSLWAGEEGTVTGVVRAADQVPVAGAKVILESRNGSRQSITTDQQGQYSFSSIAAGTFTLSVEAGGYQKATRNGVQITGGKPSTVDFVLTPVRRPMGPAQATLAPPEADYYDGTQLRASPVESTIDAAGYSSQAQSSRRLGTELHSLLGEADEAWGDPNSSVEEYQLAAQRDPSEKNIFDLGNVLLLHARIEPALDVFKQGVALYPSSKRMYIGLGIALYSRGNYDEAVGALCHASDLFPLDPRPYMFLGKMGNVSVGNANEVTKRLKRFAETNPSNPFAYYYYALNLWKGGDMSGQGADPAEVENLFRKAIQLDPHMTEAHLQLGVLLQDQRRDQEAIPQFQAAIRFQPDNPDPHYRLAQAYLRAGDKERGQEELRLYDKLRATQINMREKPRSDFQPSDIPRDAP